MTVPRKLDQPRIVVRGAGIIGLWQALVLARAGHVVALADTAPAEAPLSVSASRYAGAMLSPDCEAEAAPPLVRDLGREGVAQWLAVYPGVVAAGSLVVAAGRDRTELARFARVTERHTTLDAGGVARLEPDLAGRFDAGLYFADEAHMSAPEALAFLLGAVRDAGCEVAFGAAAAQATVDRDIVIDCRGFSARDDLPELRGVRGERVIVQAADVSFARPVRLLHPRVPLYIVPWANRTYMIGATVIESEDGGPMTVRSALELLGAAYAVHPGFAEAQILDMGAGVRPAFADNVPRIHLREGGRTIHVNGAYRHGFLLAPVLASAVAAWIKAGTPHPLIAG
jgi:glycine oxidase